MKISTIAAAVSVLIVMSSMHMYANFDADALMRVTINRIVLDVVAFN